MRGSRLVSILLLRQARGRMTAEELAEELESRSDDLPRCDLIADRRRATPSRCRPRRRIRVTVVTARPHRPHDRRGSRAVSRRSTGSGFRPRQGRFGVDAAPQLVARAPTEQRQTGPGCRAASISTHPVGTSTSNDRSTCRGHRRGAQRAKGARALRELGAESTKTLEAIRACV